MDDEKDDDTVVDLSTWDVGFTDWKYSTTVTPVPVSFSEETEFNNDVVLTDGSFKIKDSKTGEVLDVGEVVKTMQERFLILQPNFEAMEEYPALKDAYDQYKMLEKLLMENNNGKKG